MIGWRYFAVAFILATVGINSADAFGWSRATPVYRHCYASPLVVYGSWTPAYPATYAMDMVPLAIPTAAPPSSITPEPPRFKKLEMPPADNSGNAPAGPEVRSLDPFAGLAKGRCKVGFWNLSGRDISLVIEDKMVTVGRDRAITLEVPREFVWRVDQQPARTERVAEDKASHEIVIR